MTRLILLSDKDPSGVTEILRAQITRSKQKNRPKAYTFLPKASFRYQIPISFSTELVWIEFLH